MARIVKEEEYALRRNEILDTARRLVYTKGYEQMTIQDILDALQISKGAFYHYFDSKQDLLEALIDRMIDEGVQVVAPILDENLPAIEKLKLYFQKAALWKTAQKDYLLALMRVWYADENAIVRQKMYSETIRRIGPMFTSIVNQGMREGVFHPAYPDLIGDLILSIMISFGDKITALIFEPNPDNAYQQLERVMGAYFDAFERLLGAPAGSLKLVDFDVLKEWMPLSMEGVQTAQNTSGRTD